MTTRVKEVRKTSNACDACKRRKGKCSGANPCTHCKDCGMECTYSLSNKKRGPVKKLKTSKDTDGEPETNQLSLSTIRRSTPSPSSYENTLSSEFEKCSLVDLYLEHMAQGTQSTSRLKLLNPQTLAQKMRTSSVLAFVYRGLGQLSRAEQLVADARVLAGQLLEDKSSFDAAEAFIALSGYFPLHDHRNMTYLGIAHNISKAQKTVDGQRLYNFSLIGSTVTDNSMDTITKPIKEPSPMDILLTAMTKFYCNLNPCLVDALNIEKVSTLKDVQLSKEEADVIMADIMMMEYLVVQQSQGKTLRFLIKLAKILTLWLSGSVDRATKEADDTIEWDSFDAVQYLTRLGQLEKAEKVYAMFCTVCNLYGATDLMNTLPAPAVMVSTFLQAKTEPRTTSPSVSLISESNLAYPTTIDTHATIINIPFINCPPSTSPSNPNTPLPSPMHSISSPATPIQQVPSPLPNPTTYTTTDKFATEDPPTLELVHSEEFDNNVGNLLSFPPSMLVDKEDEYSFLEELLL